MDAGHGGDGQDTRRPEAILQLALYSRARQSDPVGLAVFNTLNAWISARYALLEVTLDDCGSEVQLLHSSYLASADV